MSGSQTPRDLVGCGECGAVARVKDRRTVTVRDLPAAGVPVVIRWRKRIFECRYALCPNKTWTEQPPGDRVSGGPHGPGQAVGVRAGRPARPGRGPGRRAARRRLAHDHAAGHASAGNRWSTTRNDSTGCPRSASMRPRSCGPAGTHPTLYATGIADLTPGRPARLLDVVEGRSGTVLSGWLAARDENFRAQIVTASLDPFRGYATALAAQLPAGGPGA